MADGAEGDAQASLLGWAQGARVRSAACKAQAARAAESAAAIGDQVNCMIERAAEHNPEYAERLRAIIATATDRRAAISEWKRDSTPGRPGVRLLPEAGHEPGAAAVTGPENQLRRMAVIQDRDRASGELQDQVIQGIFTAGLTLHDAARLTTEPEVRWRIEAAADDLDELIRILRDALFDPAG